MTFTPEQIKSITATVRQKHEEAQRTATEMRAALELVQRLCEHEYVEQGHDHNYVYYKCNYCGKTKQV